VIDNGDPYPRILESMPVRGLFNVRSTFPLRPLGLVLLLALPVFLSGFLFSAQQVPSLEAPETLLRATTQLVLVDVVVTEQHGRRVPGLKREEFAVKEEGKPQDVAVFQWNEGSKPRVAPAPLPPNVFTNRPEYHPPRGPLTIVLLDALNTPRTDQVFMAREMARYFAALPQVGQWTAIVSLTDRLRVLQDFTTDRELLLAVMEKYNPQQSGSLGVRQEVTSKESDDEYVVLLEELKACGTCEPLRQMIEELRRFQENTMALADKGRMRRTMEALQALAHAVVGYQGRKNLIWVSAAFPAMYGGDKYGRHRSVMGDELIETARLLNNARLAVYPVDPRGLLPADKPESYDEFEARIKASQPPPFEMGSPPSPNPSDSERHPLHYLYTSQTSMKAIAENTGGQAFYNRNDLSNAVGLAVADGSSYYTLGYYPSNANWDGRFRRIEVKLARKGLRLRYRTGYYAIHAAQHREQANTAAGQISVELLAALDDPFPATGVTFRAYVPPPQPAALAQVKVEFWLDRQSVLIEGSQGGRGQLDVDFVVAAVSPEGKLLKDVAKRANWSLSAGEYNEAAERGIVLPASIELLPGKYELRLLVRDNHTGLLGRIDTPLELKPLQPGPSQ